MDQRPQLRKMANSFESIGSCSLDVDITASESSGLLESRGGCGASLSQRTLHSLDSQRLVAHSTDELSTSSRHYVKRAAKLFDSTDVSNSDDSVFTPPRARPSYVSLSCSVSGYTRATNYSSSRLRDSSPCSRQSGNPTPLLLARTSPARVMNGHHTSDTVDCASIRLNGTPSDRNKVLQYSKHSYVTHSGPSLTYNETSSWHSALSKPDGNTSNGANTSKSFIQQRVERLYGRGALAQGFFRKTKLNATNGDAVPHSSEHRFIEDESGPSSFPELPVLRLLRPEFREQLSISSSTNSSPWWRQRQSPPRNGTESASCNGSASHNGTNIAKKERIIPITIESDHNANEKEVVVSEVFELKKEDANVCDVAIQAQEAPQDLQPAAPEVVPAVEPPSTTSQPELDSNVKDGRFFLQLLGQESQRLLAIAAETEVEFEAQQDWSEEVSGKIRTAIGQARLLVRQKLQQFEGLCHRNLTQSTDQEFPTTCDDLAGFWDMVKLQVAHVDSLFQELDEMRKNGWQEVSPKHTAKNGKSKPARRSSTANTPKSSPKLSEKAQEAARLRDEQRKKMMEDRRRSAAKLQKKTEVEIFVPDT